LSDKGKFGVSNLGKGAKKAGLVEMAKAETAKKRKEKKHPCCGKTTVSQKFNGHGKWGSLTAEGAKKGCQRSDTRKTKERKKSRKKRSQGGGSTRTRSEGEIVSKAGGRTKRSPLGE